ncbi:hypothetical protein ACIA49_39145 [Kribbella sp. NPDC051587]|uniref:hypothetical protein n=1 Tax=Kribbella sp. NPDC051587 TaxID=3364119 RepID=UPI0037AD3DE6
MTTQPPIDPSEDGLARMSTEDYQAMTYDMVVGDDDIVFCGVVVSRAEYEAESEPLGDYASLEEEYAENMRLLEAEEAAEVATGRRVTMGGRTGERLGDGDAVPLRGRAELIPVDDISTVNDPDAWVSTDSGTTFTHPTIYGWVITRRIVRGADKFRVTGVFNGEDGHHFGTCRTFREAIALVGYALGA